MHFINTHTIVISEEDYDRIMSDPTVGLTGDTILLNEAARAINAMKELDDEIDVRDHLRRGSMIVDTGELWD